jgi:hypothetical protein
MGLFDYVQAFPPESSDDDYSIGSRYFQEKQYKEAIAAFE